MISIDELSMAFARNIGVIKSQTEGLTHADTFVQTHGGNCLNWLLGHIAVHRGEVPHG